MSAGEYGARSKRKRQPGRSRKDPLDTATFIDEALQRQDSGILKSLKIPLKDHVEAHAINELVDHARYRERLKAAQRKQPVNKGRTTVLPMRAHLLSACAMALTPDKQED